ncbi:hypothetical protein QR680_012367 [Steinernema hermaphroditum]|uniref:ZP domain-containing protein n=1 Tax=Steinernema hermaphroditum TaxID=289476 RepID=A0AA39M0E1_9BILA|nr:hypothetical protein QR680_012367 [Steinernema hermaphroditum]
MMRVGMLPLLIAAAVLLVAPTSAKTVNNSLIETPKVTCGPETILIEGKTRNDFEGVIFIKNWRRTEGCYRAYEKLKGSLKPRYEIPLSELSRCGLEMRRNPDSRELEIFTVFVFSFHPNFVTVGDRAFAVHCLFQQQQFTVATKFNFISDITTRGVLTGVAEPPEVALTIVPGRVPDPNLQPAGTVPLGTPLMFIWHLRRPSEIYGIRVFDCLAETLDGRKIKVLDNGCTLDDHIMSNVQYAENSKKAFADAMAFNFPDAEDVWMKCHVKTCVIQHEHMHLLGFDESHLCQKTTTCSKRSKRDTTAMSSGAFDDSEDDSSVIISGRMTVVDPSGPLRYQAAALTAALNESSALEGPVQTCMEKSAFAVGSALLATLYLATMGLSAMLAAAIFRTSSSSKSFVIRS